MSVGELVRQAIAKFLDEDRAARIAAAEELCSLNIEGFSDDWEIMEEEYERSKVEGLP